MNNFRRLKEEANIDTVVHFLGLRPIRKGTAFFIRCPLPEHPDTHPTNCYYKKGWNNVYCCVCNKAINAIDLIMYTEGCSYGEAADLLWEIEGSPDWYYDDDKKSSSKKESFRLSREEAEVIGIHFPGWVLAPKGVRESKEELLDGEEYDPRQLEYIACKVQKFTYLDFMDQTQYECLVYNKAKEKALHLQKVQREFQEHGLPKESLKSLDEQIEICVHVMERIKDAA